MDSVSRDPQSLFIGRDESWLSFNRRVLEEAQDPTNPLLERVKFLAITASNLDEFVEIRVAGIMQRIEDGYTEPGFNGLTPRQTLDNVVNDMHAFVRDQYRCWTEDLRPSLYANGVRVLGWREVDETARAHALDYYQREVDPLLTPITIDPAHPFPRVLNKALCLALLLRRKRKGSSGALLGVVTVPRALPRLVPVPSSSGTHDFIFLADLIERNAAAMYRGYEILSTAAFRVTRNSNLYFQEEESRSLLDSVRSELHNRRKGDAVRLEIEEGADNEVVDRLPPPPYDPYDAVVNFVQLGSQDPRVVSMKQTLYRTSSDSPMFHALTEAAQTKEVTVVVELMARFDEASNIRWARNLEDAGVQVFHGIVGLKTHCKLAMLIRRDPDGITRRYAHLGTGNYNPNTARFYTDISLLTADPEITASVHSVFNYLTAHSESDDYAPLLVAPLTLAESTIRMIHREAEHAAAGRPAHIIAKMNSLLEQAVIEALYAASRAGVQIDLIVRGICSLRPGIPGVSENIRVRSVVGRFLEHSRIFYFANGGEDEIYCGSADWMPRNLFERCEVVFPIRDAQIRHRIRHEILAAYMADTAKSRMETAGGDYPRVRAPEGKCFSAQDFFIRLAESRDSIDNIPPPASEPEADFAVATVAAEEPSAPAKPHRRRAPRKQPEPAAS